MTVSNRLRDHGRWRDPGVVLKKHPLRWRKLPVTAKTGILAGVQRVRRLRADIAASAQVAVMPPVQVLDIGWVASDFRGCIHGMSSPLRVGGEIHFFVKLAAPTVLYADDTALRGILLHEFSHCFNSLRRVVTQLDAGGPPRLTLTSPDDSLDDDKWDREMLERPEDWFGPGDVAIFPYWHSRLLDTFMERVEHEWVLAGRPVEEPDRDYEVNDRITIPLPVIDHIRRLVAEGKTTPTPRTP